MKEVQVSPGENIARACERLAAEAPAFMVFNDIRVEAAPGEAASDLCGRWSAEMDRRRAEYESSDAYKAHQAEAAWRRVEEARVREESMRAVEASGVREKYPWTDAMGEISGFGGGYEQACRDMVYAGLAWVQNHPGVSFADARAELDKILGAACPDCSGAMHGATMNVVAFVMRNGWDAYVAAMTKREGDRSSHAKGTDK